MRTIEDMKAARMLLGWTQDDLAKASRVSIPSVKRIEAGSDLSVLRRSTLDKLQSAFEAQGIRFLSAGDIVAGHGVEISPGAGAGDPPDEEA